MNKLLEIKNLKTIASDDHNKKILTGLDLTINPGEVHVIMGPNGAGKSTLANTILNNPRYIVTEGDIIFDGEIINDMPTNERAKKGIFMSFQSPIEVSGVTVASFIKSIVTALNGKVPNLYNFSKELEAKANLLGLDKSYLYRDLNVGFSGGEKKKIEMLQLLMLNPKLAILDETDSGLDVDAVKIVSKGINEYKNMENGVLIITHSLKMLEDLKVDYIHILVDGKIVASGDRSLANEIEEQGFAKYLK